ncbi:MAG: bifunctional DNA-formamidopyrimidine glycosylase/DNA-(apurinic or apyrimidinic site) lyase [Candidatus Sericytochromatia bacterium]|nr:bifunctional DNA-formamidopyrimidine glycosylase/DNA-(apurinic or apyrimidinic site) lyase [Candidatus Tanganyikabacteria bacterium]
MPELPEVETIRRDIAPLIVARRIESADAAGGPRYGRVAEAVGRTVRALARRGKYLLFDLEDRELVIHLGMSGRLFVASSAPASPHLRAEFGLEGGDSLCFVDMRKFGTLCIVRPGQYAAIPTLARMGPEPLSDAFEQTAFVRAVARQGPCIKAVLLAQKVVAGLGNIYVDEALHRSGIHPESRGIGRAQALRLHRAIRDVLTEAIEDRGTTFSLYRDGHLAEGRHYERLRVYDRAGRPCPACGSPIAKIRVAQRGTHYCPACQSAPLS